ncbi:MAG: amidohydrolase family protein, partial [Pseudomonadales bacterium]|nr:amidohydrolase family protein [Pseudomonadales bacterium]
MEAIKAATSVPAEMLYQEGQIGSLQVGAYADIIAVTEDPLANISALERVSFVMSNGVVIKNHLLK